MDVCIGILFQNPETLVTEYLVFFKVASVLNK